MEQPRRKKKKQKRAEQKAEEGQDGDHFHDHDYPTINEQQDSRRLKKDPAAPKRFKRYVSCS